MHKNHFIIILIFFFTGTYAQVIKEDNELEKEIATKEIDSVRIDTNLLDEVLISKVKLDPEELKQFQLLQNLSLIHI